MLKEAIFIGIVFSSAGHQASVHCLTKDMDSSSNHQKYDSVKETNFYENPEYEIDVSKRETFPREQLVDPLNADAFLLHRNSDSGRKKYGLSNREYFSPRLMRDNEFGSRFHRHLGKPINKVSKINLRKKSGNYLNPDNGENGNGQVLEIDWNGGVEVGDTVIDLSNFADEILNTKDVEYESSLWDNGLQNKRAMKTQGIAFPEAPKKYSPLQMVLPDFLADERRINYAKDGVSKDNGKHERKIILNPTTTDENPNTEKRPIKPSNTVKRWLAKSKERTSESKTMSESFTLPIIRGNIENKINYLRKRFNAKDANSSTPPSENTARAIIYDSLENDLGLSPEEQKNLVFASMMIALALLIIIVIILIPLLIHIKYHTRKKRGSGMTQQKVQSFCEFEKGSPNSSKSTLGDPSINKILRFHSDHLRNASSGEISNGLKHTIVSYDGQLEHSSVNTEPSNTSGSSSDVADFLESTGKTVSPLKSDGETASNVNYSLASLPTVSNSSVSPCPSSSKSS